MDVQAFLPSRHLVVDEWLWNETDQAGTLMVSVLTPTAACPVCQQVSGRVHSRYTRTLADVPWGPLAITLLVHVRRFRCLNGQCARRIFAERLPDVAAPFARRSVRLATRQQQLGVLTGGTLTAAICQAWRCPVSRITVGRLIQHLPDPHDPPPTVIGVDDWAFRKGQRYGTIIVDLERHTVLDLLPDRTSATLAAWLHRHPSIRVVSRDRALAYSEGIRTGAPLATQVADRWHLLRNVVETLTDVLIQQSAGWRKGLRQIVTSELQAAQGAVPALPLDAGASDDQPPGDPARRDVRKARYDALHTLAATGLSVRALARASGLSRNTVRKWLHTDTFPERAARSRRPSVLDGYKPYIRERWHAGNVTGRTIYQEILAQGYAGKVSTFKAFVTTLRRDHQQRPAPPRLPSPRQIIGWVCQPPAERSEAGTLWLLRLGDAHGGVAQGLALAERFFAMVRDRQPALLAPWLHDAKQSSVRPFRTLAGSMERDATAIQAGLALRWSTGMVEGHINRLKYLKRQMFGRASLATLRKRLRYRPA
ncbi:MAG TPA: ISL3 family transposase [Herpetosiphonaceae bacterium]